MAFPAGDTKSDVRRLSDLGIDMSGYLPSEEYADYPGYADYSAVASEDEVRTRSERRERAERLEREMRDRGVRDLRDRQERERQERELQAREQQAFQTRYSRRTAQGVEQMRQQSQGGLRPYQVESVGVFQAQDARERYLRNQAQREREREQQQAQRLRQYQTYGRGIRADGQYGQTDGQWKVPEEGIMFTTSIGGRTKQVTADQQFLMKLGIAANGNVNIQSFVMFGGTQSAFRLYCNRCSATQTVVNPSVFSNSKEVAPELVDFCLAHRHDGGLGLDCQPETTLSEAPTGRMFRDDE